jgi:hypothetical protein
MVRSTIKPNTLWLRRIDGNILTLRVRWDIHTVEVEDMEGKHTEYEYDEREIKYTLPEDITTVTAFKEYMMDKAPELLVQAKQVVVKEKPKHWQLRKLAEVEELKKALPEKGIGDNLDILRALLNDTLNLNQRKANE